MAFGALVLSLGFAISLLSGFLGIGGGIVMAPVLLYLPPLLGFEALDMRQVTGLTITQALFACLAGVVKHDAHRHVNRRLVAWMGGTIALSALAGSILSRWIANEALMLVFAGLAITAAILMWLPMQDREAIEDGNGRAFYLPLALLIALVVGVLGGMVGQGGSFILIPLMLYGLGLPTRVVIGSNLGIVLLASVAGFAGKLATGQIPLLPAAFLVAGALPGAHLGSVLSQRTSPRWLRNALALVIGLAALGIVSDVVERLLTPAPPAVTSHPSGPGCRSLR
jgi:uncharacterized membrane protein YfcA